MKSTIVSLAIIKSNWDMNKSDYIENFIPFIAQILLKKKYEGVSLQTKINEIQNDFRKDFGLDIPYHPLQTIINRAKKRNLIVKSSKQFFINKENLNKLNFKKKSENQSKEIDNIIHEFLTFSKDLLKKEITHEIAEKSFINYLKKYDSDLLFEGQEKLTILEKTDDAKNYEYFFYKFIEYCYFQRKDLFKIIENISIGHLLASAILYQRKEFYNGNLKDVNYYFDTNFILRLLGVEGEYRKQAYEIFLKNLSTPDTNFFIFEHTYDEIKLILENCKPYLDIEKYDPLKSNRTLKYFIEHSKTISDIDMLLLNIPTELKNKKIQIKEKPEVMEGIEYQIAEDELQKDILDMYNRGKSKEKYYSYNSSIKRDIDSIVAIYKLRRGRVPTQLSELKHLFITTNNSLAYASKKFEEKNKGDKNFFFPTVLTDVFMGTIIWLNSPLKVVELNEKKIIADCYAALEPSKELFIKFQEEIEKLKELSSIDEKQVFLLRASHTAQQFLMSKTYGDVDNFSDRTISEILEEVQTELKKEEQEKSKNKLKEAEYILEQEKQEKALLREELEKTKKRDSNIDQKINLFSRILSIIILFVIAIIFYLISNIVQNIYISLIIKLLGIANLVFGFTFIKYVKNLEQIIYKRLRVSILETI